MKLNNVGSATAAGNFDEQFFSIEDTSMIFDILRNRMYSDPIRAICREITCNARDAHRESGKADVPVEITLPTRNDPYLKIKDFGPGISPERISNVYIKYTASSKRSDNSQTGGFGLGAKTPFAYADAFSINTIVDGKFYSYSAFIDETRLGKLALLNEEITDLCNGTEIVIPIQQNDVETFVNGIIESTKHWDVRPILKGRNIAFPEMNFSFKGEDWAISQFGGYNRTVSLIIDKIEYPLNFNDIRDTIDFSDFLKLNQNLYLYFNVGELSISASREQVYLDKPTKTLIAERYSKAIKEIRKICQEKIDAIDNFKEAYINFSHVINSIVSNYDFFSDGLNWRGNSIKYRNYLSSAVLISITKGKHIRGKGYDYNKISKNKLGSYFTFEKDDVLYMNDLDVQDISMSHATKLLEKHPGVKNIIVLHPNKDIDSVKDEIVHCDLLGFKYLSDVITVRNKSGEKSYNRSGVKTTLFKFNNATNATGNYFCQTSIAEMEENKKDKAYILIQNEYGVRKSDKFDFSTLKYLSTKLNVDIYAVDKATTPDKIKILFEDISSLEEMTKEYVSSLNLDLIGIYYATNIYGNDSHSYKNSNMIYDGVLSLIKDNNSLYLKYVACISVLNQLKSDNKLLSIYNLISKNNVITSQDIDNWLVAHPELNYKELADQVESKYEMLSITSSYGLYEKINQNKIANYINLIDKN